MSKHGDVLQTTRPCLTLKAALIAAGCIASGVALVLLAGGPS